MRYQRPEHAVVVLLRQCFAIPRCQVSRSTWRPARQTRLIQLSRSSPHLSQQRRTFHIEHRDGPIDASALFDSLPNHEPVQFQAHQPSLTSNQGLNKAQTQDGGSGIAVLGGGITGLAAAYNLTKEFPDTHITVYEGNSRLGGWLNSERVKVEGDGDILFEQGPRTLRANTSVSTLCTLELIQELKLQDEILLTSKDSESARSRFIYYPDRLVRMPGPGQDFFTIAWSLMTEPVFDYFVIAMLRGFLQKERRPAGLDDQSIGHFLERRAGYSEIGDNLVSAVLHGIYAGDIYQLSAKSLLPKLWHLDEVNESLPRGQVNAMLSRVTMMERSEYKTFIELMEKVDVVLARKLQGSSVYTFKQGIGALATALEKALEANPNVRFLTGHNVKTIEWDDENDKIKISTTRNMPPVKYKKAISTISGRALSTLTKSSLPSLVSIHAVTVMVVNLYYTDEFLLPEHGFGYLIPRSIPYEQNPECALGVVFDSDTIQGQDSVKGTKLTVMLGGHWWDSYDSYPDEAQGLQMAKSIVSRHLKINVDPTAWKVGLHKECIPQYTVGHDARMKKAHQELMIAFNGKLAVAGNSYAGVGLNDCVGNARQVVKAYKENEKVTGLEQFLSPRLYYPTKVV